MTGGHEAKKRFSISCSLPLNKRKENYISSGDLHFFTYSYGLGRGRLGVTDFLMYCICETHWWPGDIRQICADHSLRLWKEKCLSCRSVCPALALLQ